MEIVFGAGIRRPFLSEERNAMLQLAPRGEIAVPMFKLEAPQLRDVKTEQFCWGSLADIGWAPSECLLTP